MNVKYKSDTPRISYRRIVLTTILLVFAFSLSLPALKVADSVFPGIAAFTISLVMIINPEAWAVVLSLDSMDSFALHGGIANILFMIRFFRMCRTSHSNGQIGVASFTIHCICILAILLSEQFQYGKYQIGFYWWMGSHISLLLFSIVVAIAFKLKNDPTTTPS